ncbi:MAG TPA: glycosyltransferase family 4 protein [Mucilaginibacter sp.]|nr:glycosyltransferase family 4 protein [Mucilaginibacter sp.]
MKVAFITRSTLYTVPGGDTIQALQTAKHLGELGIDTDIKLSNETIDYSQYTLLHFFNLARPADILYHSKKACKPFVVSTILCNYSEYDKYHRKGAGRFFSYLSGDRIEYLKTIARWIKGSDKLASVGYLWKGQRSSIRYILRKASVILPNSASEYKRINQSYQCNTKYLIIPNGIDAQLFKRNCSAAKDPDLVLCVARIEGIKNQLNLIRALNDTKFNLVLIGSYAPNQRAYFDECRSIAAKNITFINHVPQEQLVKYYQRAKVHILPSWFETTGLSSLEAAVMGCNIVITDKGDAKEYFGSNAFYCDPADPASILAAIEKASRCRYNEDLHEMIMKRYTWKQAALQTLKAYQSISI